MKLVNKSCRKYPKMLHSQKCVLFLHDEIKSDLFFSVFLIIYSFCNKTYMFLSEKNKLYKL